MARPRSSREVLSNVVEAIYDCALNPERWPNALRLVAEITHSSNVAIATLEDQKRIVNGAEHGYDPAFWKIYSERFADNPLLIRTRPRPLGQVYTTSMLGDLQEFRRSQFYHEWIKAQRFGDLIGVNTLRSGRRGASLVANRKNWQPRFGKRELQIIGLLAPHACRTFAISDALDLGSITSKALEATLDALATGVYLVGRDGRIVYMNAAAEHQINCGNCLGIVNSRLKPMNHCAQTALGAAIAEAITDEAATPRTGVAVALPGTDEAGLVATFLPLDRGQRWAVSGAFAGAAAVFVQDPAIAPSYPGEAFAKLYRLTGAELRVLLAIAPGLSVKDAAAVLGIGEVTARTHLQHIFSKTGTSKQTELLNLLRNAVPPVKAS